MHVMSNEPIRDTFLFVTYSNYSNGLRKTKTTALAISNYIWDGSNMICEYASSAASGKVYIYGHTLISQGNSWYYLYNAHGDVVKYTNANGAVLQSYDYDAFGEEADPSTTDANPFRYAGQYFDDETGTYYLRARYYNPGNGRFTQQDSWGYADPEDPLSLNLYVYCYGNPLMFVDINGHWPTWSQIGTALLIGVAAVATAAAVVATAGAAGAAIGAAAGVYLGVSASTAATITTVATGAAYVVAGANIVVGANDINEVFTGHNIIRDDLMGGNQALYADAKMILAIGSASLVQIGVDYTIANSVPASTLSEDNRPIQDHHFATNKNPKYTPRFNKIVSRYGLDLDDDWNIGSMRHQGRHPNEYHEYVLQKMLDFDSIANGDKNKFLQLFEGLKQEIMNNPDMLRKYYWKGK